MGDLTQNILILCILICNWFIELNIVINCNILFPIYIYLPLTILWILRIIQSALSVQQPQQIGERGHDCFKIFFHFKEFTDLYFDK